MAFVRGFQHDVFVSYATADNTPAENGWITAFVSCLGEEVKSALKARSDVEIWFDRTHIDGEEDLPKHIRDGVQTSSCLVVVLSKAYTQSKWCRAERQSFFQAPHVVNYPSDRVFLVDIGTLPPEQKPVDLLNFRGRLFHEEHGVRSRLGHPSPNRTVPDHQPFFAKLESLATAIADRLLRLSKEIERFSTVEKLENDLRDHVKSLKQDGFDMLVSESGYGHGTKSRSDFAKWIVRDCRLDQASLAILEVLEKCGENDVKPLTSIVDCLLPLRYCDDLSQLRDSLEQNNLRLVEQRVGDCSIAEIIMAGVDCKPINCLSRAEQNQKLMGITALEILESAELGPDDLDWNVEYLLRDLVQQHAFSFQKTKVAAQGNVEDLAKQLKVMVNNYSLQKKRTVYGLVRLPTSGAQRSAAMACLQEICSLVPKLVFVEIVSRVGNVDEFEVSMLDVIRRRHTVRRY